MRVIHLLDSAAWVVLPETWCSATQLSCLFAACGSCSFGTAEHERIVHVLVLFSPVALYTHLVRLAVSAVQRCDNALTNMNRSTGGKLSVAA